MLNHDGRWRIDEYNWRQQSPAAQRHSKTAIVVSGYTTDASHIIYKYNTIQYSVCAVAVLLLFSVLLLLLLLSLRWYTFHIYMAHGAKFLVEAMRRNARTLYLPKWLPYINILYKILYCIHLRVRPRVRAKCMWSCTSVGYEISAWQTTNRPRW